MIRSTMRKNIAAAESGKTSNTAAGAGSAEGPGGACNNNFEDGAGGSGRVGGGQENLHGDRVIVDIDRVRISIL